MDLHLKIWRQNGPSDAGQTGTTAPASREAAQVAVSSSEQPSPADAASLERIKSRLAQEPSLVLPSEPPMFSVFVEAKLPSLDSFLGPGWTNGPALPMAVSHREFLDMVTPKVAQPYGSFGPKELAVLLPHRRKQPTSCQGAWVISTNCRSCPRP